MTIDHEAKAREIAAKYAHEAYCDRLASDISVALREAEERATERCAKIINTLANCKAIRCDIDADGKRSTAEFAKNAVAAIRSRSETDE